MTLAAVADRTKLPLEGVEFLLMKALALHLVEGIIDQVDATVQVGGWVAAGGLEGLPVEGGYYLGGPPLVSLSLSLSLSPYLSLFSLSGYVSSGALLRGTCSGPPLERSLPASGLTGPAPRAALPSPPAPAPAQVSWVQPRVLTLPGVEALLGRLEGWVARVESAAGTLEEEAVGVVAVHAN